MIHHVIVNRRDSSLRGINDQHGELRYTSAATVLALQPNLVAGEGLELTAKFSYIVGSKECGVEVTGQVWQQTSKSA